LPGVADLTAADFEALGVYDPDGPDAAQRLELLEYLVSLGATDEDLVRYRDQLPGLASVVTIRGGRAFTLAEAAEHAGISQGRLLTIIRAAGFPEPGPDDRVISENLAALAGGMAAVETVFGEDAVLPLIRVMGSAMARVADAFVSAFLVNVEPAVRDEDPVGLGVARANAEAGALIPNAASALETLLREHIIAARRSALGDLAASGYETQRLSVGFVDLVGSTALAQRLDTRELGAALTAFEHAAADTITAGGGRVVKLIGDEVMFTATAEQSACHIALALVDIFHDHPVVPPVRAGLAVGDVLLRDGDVFGPVVNLAARAVKLARASEVVAPLALVLAAGVESEPIGQRQLKGFEDDVGLCRLAAG
jgi:class 3 adenylate cyclase